MKWNDLIYHKRVVLFLLYRVYIDMPKYLSHPRRTPCSRTKRSNKRTQKRGGKRTQKRGGKRNGKRTQKHRGGRGAFTTGASQELAQSSPAPF